MNDVEPLRELPETNRGGEFFTRPPPYELHDTARLYCRPTESFKPLSNYVSTVVLKDDGKLAWDPPAIHCEPVSELRELPKTQNLNEFVCDVEPPYLLHDEARLVCDTNHRYRYPARTVSRVVLRDGKLVWHPDEIKCVPPTCSPPKDILHGRPDNLNFVFGESFSYRCDPGYKLNRHTNKFFCNYNDTYVPNIPDGIACEPILCPLLKAPENGFVRYSDGQMFDSVATFTCDQDYQMIKGQTYRVCQSDGTWSGEEVICAQLHCPPMDPSVKIFESPVDENGWVPFNLVDCGKPTPLLVKCFPTGRWQYEHPYCDRKVEKLRLAINPDALAEWNSKNAPSLPPAPVPDVSSPVPALKPKPPAAPASGPGIGTLPSQPRTRTDVGKSSKFYTLLLILVSVFLLLSALSWFILNKL